MSSPSETDPRRRDAFRLVDLCVFIAATAFAFAAIRTVSNESRKITTRSHSPWITVSVHSLGENLQTPPFLVIAVLILLTAWSAALGACHVWRREHRVKAIFMTPGLLACVAVLLVLAVAIVIHRPMDHGSVNILHDGSWNFLQDKLPETVCSKVLTFLLGAVGIGMPIAWAALLGGRAWRKPNGWVDWTGLAVGICWIAIGLACL